MATNSDQRQPLDLQGGSRVDSSAIEWADHRVDGVRRDELASLVVHTALAVSHAIRYDGRQMAIEQPPVDMYVGVERDRYRVDRRGDRAVRFALTDPFVGA